MEVLNFSEYLFSEIPVQDNPAYFKEECIMIVKDYMRQALFAIIHICPEFDPSEDSAVTQICECYKLEDALRIAYFLAHTKIENE